MKSKKQWDRDGIVGRSMMPGRVSGSEVAGMLVIGGRGGRVTLVVGGGQAAVKATQ